MNTAIGAELEQLSIPLNKLPWTFLRHIWRGFMKGLISAKLVTAPIFWVIKGTKEEIKLLPYVSVEIIELTLERYGNTGYGVSSPAI
jgi:hypothetical protein